jgi:hypothetical protein
VLSSLEAWWAAALGAVRSTASGAAWAAWWATVWAAALGAAWVAELVALRILLETTKCESAETLTPGRAASNTYRWRPPR